MDKLTAVQKRTEKHLEKLVETQKRIVYGLQQLNGEVRRIAGDLKKTNNTFIRKKLKRLQGIHENLFPVLISHMVSGPGVKKYAKEKGIALYLSSQF